MDSMPHHTTCPPGRTNDKLPENIYHSSTICHHPHDQGAPTTLDVRQDKLQHVLRYLLRRLLRRLLRSELPGVGPQGPVAEPEVPQAEPAVAHARRPAWAAEALLVVPPRMLTCPILEPLRTANKGSQFWHNRQRKCHDIWWWTHCEIQRIWPFHLRCATFCSKQSTQASSHWSGLSIAPSRSSPGLACGPGIRLARAVALLDTC